MIRVVITGGPSTGKTSIVNQLSDSNYTIFPEVARVIIKEQLALGSNKVPWEDVVGFSQIVLNQQIEDYNLASPAINIYDRGIPDLIGYLNYGKENLFEHLQLTAKELTYQFVFILPPWKDIYETDNERRESFEEANAIHQNIKEAYENIGYRTIEVPIDTIENRLKFILQQING